MVRGKSFLPCRLMGRFLGRISQKSWAPAHHFRGSPIQTLIAAMDGPNLSILGPIRTWCVYGIGNNHFLAAIRVWQESLSASRRAGRIFGRISQKARVHPRHFRGSPIQTIIAAKDGSN